mmetsp:Transcript_4866/g.12293  ORF Transcript_4866/g.12293 Transcript_4866/m.12293 type:complete len:211 (+) Transcript_4866:570-1202(+)
MDPIAQAIDDRSRRKLHPSTILDIDVFSSSKVAWARSECLPLRTKLLLESLDLILQSPHHSLLFFNFVPGHVPAHNAVRNPHAAVKVAFHGLDSVLFCPHLFLQIIQPHFQFVSLSLQGLDEILRLPHFYAHFFRPGLFSTEKTITLIFSKGDAGLQVFPQPSLIQDALLQFHAGHLEHILPSFALMQRAEERHPGAEVRPSRIRPLPVN